MDRMTPAKFRSWCRRRHNTYLVYLFQYFAEGLAATLIVTVLWVYLKNEVPGSHKKLFYGFISCIRNVPPILFSVITSRWVDKTRKAKEFIIVANLLSILGMILFMLPYSPYLLAFGRFLDGFVLTSRVVTTAEVSRSYPGEDLQRKLPLCSFSRLFGLAIGPVIAIAFVDTDFMVWKFHFTWGNTCALFILVLKVLQTILVVAFTSNISKEYDLKMNEESLNRSINNADSSSINNPGHGAPPYEQLDESDDEIQQHRDSSTSRNSDIDENISLLNVNTRAVLAKMLGNTDILLLLLFTPITEFWQSVFYRSIPVIVLETLHYDTNVLSFFYIGYSIVFMLLLYIIITVTLKDHHVFFIGFLSFFALLVVGVCCFFLSPSLPTYTNYTLLGLFCFFFTSYEQSETVFLTVVFSKMMSSQNQGVGTGFRVMLQRIGTVPGAFFSVFVYEYFKYSSIVLFVTIVVVMVFMLTKRKTFSNPRPVI